MSYHHKEVFHQIFFLICTEVSIFWKILENKKAVNLNNSFFKDNSRDYLHTLKLIKTVIFFISHQVVVKSIVFIGFILLLS